MPMREIVLDIETQNIFEKGNRDATKLRISFVGIYDYSTGKYEGFFENDLPKLWQVLEHCDRLIGYNIKGFDIPVMNAHYAGDLTQLPQLDLMEEIAKTTGFRLKLDDVAQSTLGVGKSGSGLDAVKYYQEGRLDLLKEYCLQDVKVTKQVYEFGRMHGHVTYNDRYKGEKIQVPVNFMPQKVVKPAMNLSLGF
jgi:DEAD/DEAH box helicase domain-containing protein